MIDYEILVESQHLCIGSQTSHLKFNIIHKNTTEISFVGKKLI